LPKNTQKTLLVNIIISTTNSEFHLPSLPSAENTPKKCADNELKAKPENAPKTEVQNAPN